MVAVSPEEAAPTGDQVKLKGPTPPVGVEVMLPLQLPLQVTFIKVNAASNIIGSVIVSIWV